ncbi:MULTISPECIES: hypothetical protein [unclassified Bradyrhizobium]
MRQCGSCSLCCKLLPVPRLGKKAGQRCKHRKHDKGCVVYHTPAMPPECAVWNCRWLVNDDAADLRRPDHAHYVIDIMPDFITIAPDDGGDPQNIQVVQVWIDPKHPDAHRDPALRRWMLRRAEEGKAALVRLNQHDAIVIFAPPFDAKGEWHEIKSGMKAVKTHTFAEVLQALGEDGGDG